MKSNFLSNVHKFQLTNGLTILLDPNPTGVVSIHLGVKVGSAWERDHEAGVSHLLEHMVFKGTTSYKPGEISTLVEGSGGELNAYTSFDQTVYYINLPARHLDLGINLIREMGLEAKIDPDELLREKEVVCEEIRRGKDNPQSNLSEMLFGEAFPTHPYGRPIIGFEKTVRALSQQEIFAFYKKWYVPNNMVLGITGQFDVEKISRRIEEIFLNPMCPLTRELLTEEVLSVRPRLKQAAYPITGNYLAIAFPIPGMSHKDIPALDLLAHLLGGAATSPLEQILKEEKGLVNAIHAYAYTPRFPGLLILDAQIPDGKVEKAIAAIWQEVSRARTQLFNPADLARAKHQITSSLYYEKETCEGSCRKWVTYETTVDDYRYEERYLQALEEINHQDIRTIAQTYLNPQRATTALVHPKDKPVRLTLPKNKSTKIDHPFKLVEEVQGIQKYRLKNGLRIIVKENKRLPLISLKVAGLGGLRYESLATNGLSHLMTDCLSKETTTKDQKKIALLCEEMAGNLNTFSGKNSWGLSSSFLSDKKEIGMELCLDVLLNPLFSPDELAKEKALTLEAIKNQADQPSHVAFEKFYSLLYKKHPYGLPMMGTAKNVRAFKPKDLLRFYKSLMDPRKMVVSVVGDFNSLEMVERLAASLGTLDGVSRPKAIKAEPHPTIIRRAQVPSEKKQSHIVLGFLGTTYRHPDRYAIEILNSLLSGQSGRLFIELRDKKSLAYSVTSTMAQGIDPGYFATYIGCERSKTPEAIDGLIHELKRIQSDLSPSEVEQGKNNIIGNYEMDLQKNSAQAGNLVFNELYGQPLGDFFTYPDRILSVKTEEVINATKKYFNLNRYCLAVVG